MKPSEKIKNKILSGYVLSDTGEWISIKDQIEIEKIIIDNVINGKVLHNNRWEYISKVLNFNKGKQD